MSDLNGIMKVEKDWPEHQRASEDKFISRLEKFPFGFFVAESNGNIVGTSTSCLIEYSPSKIETYRSWDAVTNNGYIKKLEEVKNPNALYIVSIGIKNEYRGEDIFQKFVNAQIDLARKMDLGFVIAGAIMPGYDAYCRKHGNISAKKYALIKARNRFVDPLLEMWNKCGFYVPDDRHVIQNYYTDFKSRNYSALVVLKI